LHGGTINASSDGPGRGSTFMVRLPQAAARAAAPADSSDTVSTGVAGLRILVADDNQDAADSLAMLLSLEGHAVRVAHGGRAAIALAQSFRPQVVLLDIGMPELDGYGTARLLRKESWGAEIGLIALTGWGQEEDKNRAYESGFNAHLTKPVDIDQLRELLAEY
jgi:CheY-like chemotaxis protein